MKIDAHQHFWQYSPTEHAWITDDLAAIRRDFLPPDLQPELQGIEFDGSIAVQASQSEAETQFLLDLADQHPFIKGVVGWVDLQAENVEERLAHFRAHPKLVGIRHVVQSEPDDRFLLRPAFMRGLGFLDDFGLTYDMLIYPHHLPVASELVEQFPAQRFVLDHIAKPFIRNRQISPWREHIQQLAEYPNVSCKLSGMVTEAHVHQWKPGDFTPYLDTVVEAFGTDRLMIGSDWPVCRVAGTYAEVMQIVMDYVARFSENEQAKILGETAERVYGLSE